jgi:tRNA threonylcarbamoyl adenosine modification protein (Sua5/YciO/YrdC/YwlC family)
MNVVRVDGSPKAEVLAAAAACVRAGGTMIFPTDTVYGIGCAADDDRAVEAVFEAKRRPHDRPLSIHLADPAEARRYSSRLSPGARAVMRHFWPGGVTVIVNRLPTRCDAAARGGKTIGLRCPDDPICRAIIGATGPLAATSANESGARAFTGDGADEAALPHATMAIIAGQTRRRRESTVLDCSGERVRVIRSGAVDPAVIENALTGIAPVDI